MCVCVLYFIIIMVFGGEGGEGGSGGGEDACVRMYGRAGVCAYVRVHARV